MLAEIRRKDARCKLFFVMDIVKMCVCATEGHTQPCILTVVFIPYSLYHQVSGLRVACLSVVIFESALRDPSKP